MLNNDVKNEFINIVGEGRFLDKIEEISCYAYDSLPDAVIFPVSTQEMEEIRYIPVDDRMECCGGGGTFFYEHSEISGILAKRKLAHIRKIKAEFWLTDCPVCRLTLNGQLSAGDTLRLLHPVQFIDSIHL